MSHDIHLGFGSDDFQQYSSRHSDQHHTVWCFILSTVDLFLLVIGFHANCLGSLECCPIKWLILY